MTGTFLEALKQGRTAMLHHPGQRSRKREKLSAHKLWPQRRTVNPQKQCAADEKAKRSREPICRQSWAGSAAVVTFSVRRFKSCCLHQQHGK